MTRRFGEDPHGKKPTDPGLSGSLWVARISWRFYAEAPESAVTGGRSRRFRGRRSDIGHPFPDGAARYPRHPVPLIFGLFL